MTMMRREWSAPLTKDSHINGQASAAAAPNACTRRRRLQAVLDSGPPTTLL